jgi:hypothetical protein
VVEPEQLVIVETTPEVEAETVAKAKPLYKRMTGKIKKTEGKSLATKNKKLSAWLRGETRTKNEGWKMSK